MDDIVAASSGDVARRRGEAIDTYLKTGVIVLIIAAVILVGFSYLFDKPLVFDGSELPTLQANADLSTAKMSVETAVASYVDPRPAPPLPASSIRTLGHRVDPLRLALRAANGGAIAAYSGGIERGLGFLSKMQARDGSWPVVVLPKEWPQGESADFQWGKIGVSSLCLLAFLEMGILGLLSIRGRAIPILKTFETRFDTWWRHRMPQPDALGRAKANVFITCSITAWRRWPCPRPRR